jgi:hypothetical protein
VINQSREPINCLSRYQNTWQYISTSNSFQFFIYMHFYKHGLDYELIVPVLNELSTTPWRRMGESMYRSTFLTSELAGGKWSASRPGRFTFGERAPCTHWVGGWVDPRVGLDDLEKRKFLTLPELELRLLSRPARSQSLYQLRHPGSWLGTYTYMYINYALTIIIVRITGFLNFVHRPVF